VVYLKLFLSFLKIGFTCFGGATMVPLVNAEMVSHGWMTLEEVGDIVAIAEMTPGPLGTNCATFAGMRVGGVLGSLIAVLGVLMPSLTIGVAAGFFLNKFKNSRYLESALTGIRPASIGLVISIIISMGLQNYVAWQPVVIGIVAFVMLWKFKLSVQWIVITSAALGIVLIR